MLSKKLGFEIILTIIGAVIMAISISFFLLPNELSSGGFSGIATIFYYKLNIPVGITIILLNLPLFLFSGFKIGKSFFVKSIVGTVGLSFFIEIFEKYGALTNDKILACIYGGILTGIGTAIILKSNSSTGGSELLSIIIKKYNKKFEIGTLITIVDFIIVILNAVILGKIEICLYSLIAIYILGFMIDIVFEGIFFTKLLIIISDKNEVISKEIQEKIGRGVTGLYGRGMYREDDKLITICAIQRRDISDVKKIILNIDNNAFVIITNSREVLGRGFKRNM